MDLSQYPEELVKRVKDMAKDVAKQNGYYITWTADGEIITDVRGYALSDEEWRKAADTITKELLQRGLN